MVAFIRAALMIKTYTLIKQIVETFNFYINF